MNIHKNASITPKGRANLIREIDRIGLKPAAAAAGLSTRTARKWQRRFPGRPPWLLWQQLPAPGSAAQLRQQNRADRSVAQAQRLTYERIAERVGLSRSAVARTCKAAGAAELPTLQDPSGSTGMVVPVVNERAPHRGLQLPLTTARLPRNSGKFRADLLSESHNAQLTRWWVLCRPSQQR